MNKASAELILRGLENFANSMSKVADRKQKDKESQRQQANADRSFEYLKGRDALADTRYSDEIARAQVEKATEDTAKKKKAKQEKKAKNQAYNQGLGLEQVREGIKAFNEARANGDSYDDANRNANFIKSQYDPLFRGNGRNPAVAQQQASPTMPAEKSLVAPVNAQSVQAPLSGSNALSLETPIAQETVQAQAPQSIAELAEHYSNQYDNTEKQLRSLRSAMENMKTQIREQEGHGYPTDESQAKLKAMYEEYQPLVSAFKEARNYNPSQERIKAGESTWSDRWLNPIYEAFFGNEAIDKAASSYGGSSSQRLMNYNPYKPYSF